MVDRQVSSMFNPFRNSYVFFVVDDRPERGLTACAAELIDATNDLEAMEIACSIFALLNDTFYGFGLIHGDRILAGGIKPLKYRIIKVQRPNDKVRKLIGILIDDHPVLLRSPKLRSHLEGHPTTP